MHQPICWIDRQDDGTRREIKAMVAQKRVEWKVRPSDDYEWESLIKPLPADWEELLQKMKNRYQRRTISYKDLELVTRLHQAALAAG